ncbi:MAG: hypothetical protein C0410_09075 [Anaerolinea sp.]|nr:hypothetical protein [Anaerolinea sp.]
MTTQTKPGKKKKALVFHPILIGLYPVLALLAYNIIQLDPIYAVRAIVVTLLISALVFALALLITRERYKGGLLASLALLLFLTYGHVYNLLENKSYFGHHRFMIIIWLALFGLGAWGIFSLKKKPRTLSTFLNFFSVVLIAIPLFQIVYFEVSHTKSSLKPAANPAVDSLWQPQAAAPAGSPDVYYIVLDAYTRSDKLKEVYGYDNSAFLQKLREMGFYIAECSKSNYSYTPSSMATAFNMDYLDNFAGNIIKENRSFYDLGETIKHNKVRALFSELGYRYVTFDNDIWWLDTTDSDQYISQYSSPWQKLLNFKILGNFEKYYLRSTALRVVDEFSNSKANTLDKALLSTERAHYDLINYNFAQLEQLPQAETPKFVYAHFVAPHFPYVFAPDGSFEYTASNAPGYVNEITYIEQRVLEVISNLIKDSEVPPIILLQSDHGLAAEIRNANLMAYYLPNGGEEALYPSITPVNSFRIVFNQYFGADYPLLEDVARSATYQAPYDFSIVDYPCTAK